VIRVDETKVSENILDNTAGSRTEMGRPQTEMGEDEKN
jgi:hypothetical protein